MKVVAHGPFRVATFPWQPRPGEWSLTVVCRAGFELTPSESPLVTLPKEAPDEERRLVEEAVVSAPRKRWPEVVLVGHAYAPEGKPVPSLSARLAVGALDKVIHVTGDRHLTMQGGLVGPAPFTRMPLGWDRAAGGPDTWNPAGVVMGARARDDGWGRVRLPNLEPTGASVTTRRDLVPPVGFGPIPPRWPTRVDHLHRHAAAWDEAPWKDRPLPEDIDVAYFNIAPPDQVLPEITGNELIVLENLHPRHARLSTCLRALQPLATVGVEGLSQEAPLACDTLIIDTDLGIAQLVWRGQVALAHREQEGIIIVSATRATPRTTMVLGPAAGSPVVETIAAPFVPPKAALPFQVPVPPGPSGDLVLETIAPVQAPPKAALPFGERAPVPVPAAPRPAPRFGAPPPDPVPPAPRFGAPPFVLPEAPAPSPPALIGPLARVQPSAPAEEVPEAARDGSDDAKGARGSSDQPLTAFPIERCAAIAASIARRKQDRKRILEENGLPPGVWERLDEHWAEAARQEIERARPELMRAYDAAYVGQLEKERGPITLAEYAGLVVAAERGTQGEVLTKMTLPREAMIRIERAWLARIARDAKLGAAVATAVDAARSA